MIPGSTNALLLAGAAAAEYQIERSVRFNSADSAYLSRTPSVAGNRKTWTWSGWVKRSGLGTQVALFGGSLFNTSPTTTWFGFDASDRLYYGTDGLFRLLSTSTYRDTSAWYHVLFAVDTTQAISADRTKIYVNGAEVTTFDSANYSSQNYDTFINVANQHAIGRFPWAASYLFNGLLSDIHFIDGQALDPTSFGEFDTNGVWQPKAYTGTYGTNGFHLPFSDNSTAAALGTDTSGNNNTWTVNNLSVAAGAGNDSLVDTPTNYGTDTGAGGEVRGNYATLNPLAVGGTGVSFVNGNLEFTNSAANDGAAYSSLEVNTGTWYCEIVVTGGTDPNIGWFGVRNRVTEDYATYYGYTGNKFISGVQSAYGAAYGLNDVIGIAYDADTGNIGFYKNGVSQGTFSTGLSGQTISFYFFDASGGDTLSAAVNFGQRPFAYAAPSGYKALCTQNLPDPTIADGSTAMDVVLDTGANILTAAQGAIGGSADLLWIKDRANSNNHQLIDTVRGGTATLQSNTTAAETTYSAPSGNSVAWTWDAGSSTVTNTDGSISAQVRANPSAGFSVVSWTSPSSGSGWTVGHGLNAAPFLMIDKCRSNVGNWTVYHQAQGATKALYLNTADAVQTSSAYWNDTAPSSSVFTCGTTGWYGAGFTHVTYCFAPVAGYSAFGSYTGNGSADGPFVYTGFRPRFIFVKRSDSTSPWSIYDTSRGQNENNVVLEANASTAEQTLVNRSFDLLSNGFKNRTDSINVNASGATYIYAAFAENPFKTARAR